jgi:hypothetical protein
MISKIYMRNYSYIYESAQIENFERQILSGYLTEAKLIEMYENNELSDQQIKVVEELFGGLGNIGRAIGGGLRSAGQAAGQAVGNQARKVGNAATQGAKQIGQNVRDIYQSGEAQAAADKRVAQLNNQVKILEQLFAQHVAASPNSSFAGKNLNNITLGQLKQALATKAAMASGASSAARQQGFTGGVGGAMAQGYNK